MIVLFINDVARVRVVMLDPQLSQFLSQPGVLFVRGSQLSLNAIHISSWKVSLPQLIPVQTLRAGLFAGRAIWQPTIASRLARMAPVAGFHTVSHAEYQDWVVQNEQSRAWLKIQEGLRGGVAVGIIRWFALLWKAAQPSQARHPGSTNPGPRSCKLWTVAPLS